jgi:hypothetical protein
MRALLLLGLLVGCGAPQPKPPAGNGGPVSEAADRDDCTTDDDCSLVDACCGCANGGRKVGIRTDALAAYEKGRADRCKAVSCSLSPSDHPSCNAEATCKHGHCRVQPHMNLAPVPVDAPTPSSTSR